MRLTVEQNAAINKYLIESISPENYDESPSTDKEKLEFLRDTFVAEKDWEIKRIGFQSALTEWIQGVPSAYDIYIYNSDIIEFAERIGVLNKNSTEREQDKIVNNWFHFVAARTIRLFNKYHISTSVDEKVMPHHRGDVKVSGYVRRA